MKFKFIGDWETQIEIEAFKEFQSRGGYYSSKDKEEKSNGIVKLFISDDLSDEPDPSPEQFAAIDYLIDNQQHIIRSILDRVKMEYPNLREWCGDDYCPPLNTDDDVKNAIGFGTIHLQLEHKDGIAYMGYECGCEWDDEHGLGILMHKDRIISFGAAEEAFSPWQAMKDNGTSESKRAEWAEINLANAKPKLYSPHPKYGKLKPLQQSENNMYENRLIEKGYNKDFIDLVENGQIDLNINKGLGMSFLERATQFDNEEIACYIISKKPKMLQNKYEVMNAALSAAGYCNEKVMTLLIENGFDINEKRHSGASVVSQTIGNIERTKKDNDERLSKYEHFYNFLILNGAK